MENTSKIATLLINNGVYLDDVVGRELTSGESLGMQFLREFSHIRANYNEVRQREHYKEKGWRPISDQSEGDLFVFGEVVNSGDLYELLEEAGKDAPPGYIRLAKRVSVKDIKEYLEQAGKPKWRKLEQKEKDEVLRGFGLDILRGDMEDVGEGEMEGYVTREEVHRRLNGEVEYGVVVVASERTDPQWLASGLASEEAQMYSSDPTLLRELRTLMRNK